MQTEILIVLGAPNTPSGVLSDISKSRLDNCLSRYKKGKSVLCTGGWGAHFNTAPNAHASYARAYLAANGVDESDFLDLALSENTVDDAVKIKSILSNFSNASLTIITSDYHLDRVRLIFDEVLEGYNKNYTGVESNLPEKEFDVLVQHEKNAIKAILENGLYY